MASRKSSRSMTARRNDLLRSVTELRSGRMSTNGLFRLGSQTLTEVSQQSGRVRRNSYFVVREDLRNILRGAVTGPITTYYTNNQGKSTFRVDNSSEYVAIGCKVFAGKNAAALRAWALQE